ncbi:Translation factor pelota [Thecaphora frezii]
MKLTSRHIEKDGSGKVTLTPEEDEDMYHLYNLIEEGDKVRAAAVRRVQSESSTGSIESHRVKLNLTIQVVKTTFDATGSSAPPDPSAAAASTGGEEASGEVSRAAAVGSGGGEGATLQVSGRVVEENPHVKMGAFHTLDLEINRSMTIWKENWDSVHLERLGESSDVGQRAEVGALVLGEGTASVCLLTGHMTVVRQRIDVPIPRKRKGIPASSADKATQRFYAQVYNAIVKLLQLPALRLIIIASPGFTRDSVLDYVFEEAIKRGDKILIGAEARRKFLKIHCSSPHVHSLMEVLRSPEVNAQLKDTKFAREGQLLERFMKQLASDELRAWYGEKHVFLAASRGAIGVLLISDGLFRAADPARRKRFVELVEDVRKQGAEVAIFSSMHESGRQLNSLTGIAAILTYPLDIEMVEEEEAEANGTESAPQQSSN